MTTGSVTLTLIVCSLVNHGNGQSMPTIWQMLQQTPDVSKFVEFITTANMTDHFTGPGCDSRGAVDCTTLLVPSNTAIDRAKIDWNNLTPVDRMKLIGAHIIKVKDGRITTSNWNSFGEQMNFIDVSFGTGLKLLSMVGEPRYFFSTQTPSGKSYLINDAIVEKADIMALNGVIHIIDEVFYSSKSHQKFQQYLASLPNAKITSQLWNALLSDPVYYHFMTQTYEGRDLYAVYFIVTDEGWSRVPVKQLDALKTNKTAIVSFLANHYCPNQLFFPKWSRLQLDMKVHTGFPSNPVAIDVKKLNLARLEHKVNGSVSLLNGNSRSKLIGSGVLIGQAVVNLINAPIGLAFESVEDVVKRRSPSLLAMCKTDQTCSALLSSGKQLTAFLPTPSAMARLAKLSPQMQKTYLPYLFLSGVINRASMSPVRLIAIGKLTNAIRFSEFKQNMYVEGRLEGKGYVGAEVVEADIPVTNGVVHEIDGIPALVHQTVGEYVMWKPEFSQYRQYGFVKTIASDVFYTYLVPSNKAINAMNTDSIGSRLLADKDRREFIFRRHALPYALLIDDLSLANKYNVTTANNAFTGEMIGMRLEVPNSGRRGSLAYKQQSSFVESRSGEYQFTDGIVYRIDKLMYLPEDLTVNMCTNWACPPASRG